MKVKIQDVSWLLPNYRFTIAKNETVAKIYLTEKKKKVSPQNIKTILEILAGKSWYIFEEISRIMATYRGPLLADCRQFETHNKIPNVLRYEFAKKIAGIAVTPTFAANYIAVWSGIVAAADTDTQLGTELVRGTFTTRTASLNVAYLDKFFTATEVGGLTINEIGTFVDGTGTANSGYLISRALQNIVLGVNETLTINVSISITSAT